uniref:Claudin n=1 Tax=Oncorhynchus tshawytscha TaxID=74940 RepID=A0A8C8I9W1_ONCTS
MYMMIRILGLAALCLAGWILVSSTLAIEYWTWSEVGSVVLTTSNYSSNLWKDCVSDSTGVSDCKEYPSMLGLPVFLHSVRALSICSVILGFFAGVLTLIGGKCTKIGGSELANARVTFAGGITYLASGKICLRIRSEFVDPNFKYTVYAFKFFLFEIGAAVFIGWGGSLLLIASKEYFLPRRPNSYATARTRRTYMMPNSSRLTPMPQLVQGSRGGRRIRTTRTTGTI